MKFTTKNSFNSKKYLKIDSKEYAYFDVNGVAENLGLNPKALPKSIKILLENLLRFEDGLSVSVEDVKNLINIYKTRKHVSNEIAFRPSRVLMQDFTGVPAVVDLAAMRDATVKLGGDPDLINPMIPVDLVIDHSVQVDFYANNDALQKNVSLEMKRNYERYKFLRWGQGAFKNFRLVPPGTGICHQVNLEYLAKVVWSSEFNGETYIYPDTVLGTDSHTTMVNGLSVLGWGVGGIEAEAAMLGQPTSMVLPEVVGFKLFGALPEGSTSTDLVLTVTKMLRQKGVVGKFVEFYGEGVSKLGLADRATISNMAPEYGATCGFFSVDEETLNYLRLSGRSQELINIVEHYAKAQGLWAEKDDVIQFDSVIELDLGSVKPSMAGPRRPQDMVLLSDVKRNFDELLPSLNMNPENMDKQFLIKGGKSSIGNGSVVIAAITSCTNTSNPNVMIAAGLLAKKARALGLQKKPWVKTSLAPGSQVVSEYYKISGLQDDLDSLGFNLVGYGCTTCIGNSGPLDPEIDKIIKENGLVVSAVLSGNRNFEGRVHPSVRANYLASPPLCVAYAIAGTIDVDFSKDPIGFDKHGKSVHLKDVWPSSDEIREVVDKFISSSLFTSKYKNVFDGEESWKSIPKSEGDLYEWDDVSTYIKTPPYFDDIKASVGLNDIEKAGILAVLGDSVTTDHISPAGNIAKTSPAAEYLLENGVASEDFNSYGARRGNHEVMMRGTFANTRIKNELLMGVEGGFSLYKGQQMSIYNAAMHYKKEGRPLVVIAGKEYGTGSSRDWAAKGTNLLGVKAVIAESFERIHRSNLIGMNVIPLVFKDGMTRKDLALNGDEVITISGIASLSPSKELLCSVHNKEGVWIKDFYVVSRVDTEIELQYLKAGGILQYVLKNLV